MSCGPLHAVVQALSFGDVNGEAACSVLLAWLRHGEKRAWYLFEVTADDLRFDVNTGQSNSTSIMGGQLN